MLHVNGVYYQSEILVAHNCQLISAIYATTQDIKTILQDCVRPLILRFPANDYYVSRRCLIRCAAAAADMRTDHDMYLRWYSWSDDADRDDALVVCFDYPGLAEL